MSQPSPASTNGRPSVSRKKARTSSAAGLNTMAWTPLIMALLSGPSRMRGIIRPDLWLATPLDPAPEHRDALDVPRPIARHVATLGCGEDRFGVLPDGLEVPEVEQEGHRPPVPLPEQRLDIGGEVGRRCLHLLGRSLQEGQALGSERETDLLHGLGAHAVQLTNLGLSYCRELFEACIARLGKCSTRRCR